MRQHFEGGVYWDELAEICSEISRVAGFRGAVRFQGNMVHVKEKEREKRDRNIRDRATHH